MPPRRVAFPIRARAGLALFLFPLILAGCLEAPLRFPGEDRGAREVRGVLSGDETWKGLVDVADDLLVPRGVTLTIRPGTTVRVRRADTSRTEPEFLDNGTELLVRGRIVAEGEEDLPILFEPSEGGEGPEREEASWAGIIFDGGEGSLRHCRIEGADRGIVLLSASPRIEKVRVGRAKHGLMLYGESGPLIGETTIEASEGGIYAWQGARPRLVSVTAKAGEREGLLVAPGASPAIEASLFEGPLGGVLWGGARPPDPGAGEHSTVVLARVGSSPLTSFADPPSFPLGNSSPSEPARTFRGENFIGGDETWEGEILVDGTVMVAPGAVLRIRPGTVVRFAFRDTDGNGIGESEIFIQGRIEAAGERGRPIRFTSADGGGRGRWGAVNIMGSEEEENLLQWCLVEDSYRGLHSHFSSFRLEHSLFRDNYRAVQFQESRAVISGVLFKGNSSGLRFRDSTVVIEGSRFENNTSGLQAFRSRLTLSGTDVVDNVLAGIHMRETEGVISGSRISGNSPGLRASGGRFRIEGSVVSGNSYGGIQLRQSEARIEGCRISGNVGNGLFLDSPAVVLRSNLIEGNLRHAVENNSASPVDASLNHWGVGGDKVHEVVFDRRDDPRLGRVVVEPLLERRPLVP